MISKEHRFHGLGSLRSTYRLGKTVRSAPLSLRYFASNKPGKFRVAVVVSKKIHKSALKRNRIRRRIFEIIRLESSQIKPGFNLVFSIYSDQLIDWPAAKLRAEVVNLLIKSGAISTP